MPKTIALVMAAAFALAPAASLPAAPTATPPVLKFLERQGLEVDTTFSAPGGLTGYVGTTPQGQKIVFYVPPDGSVALFGVMVDAYGRNLSQAFVHRFVQAPQFHQYYAELEKSAWIAEGDPHPQRVVYAFVDPNCPYCWSFWKEAHQAYSRGVQVRYVMVGVLGGSSPGKAAAILAAKDPGRAFAENESGFRNHSGAIKPASAISDAVHKQLSEHQSLMQRFGFDGTPGLVWKTESGDIETANGMPPPEQLAAIFGMPAADFKPANDDGEAHGP
jgi:thiol:disulfide interchange protein DsbG